MTPKAERALARKVAASVRQRKWRAENPEKHRAQQRKWRADNPEKYIELSRKYYAANRRRKYGFTNEQWDALLQRQARRCAICRASEPGAKGWHTDHCHGTKRVRGILCHHCNVGLGHFKDNIETLQAAIRYLKQ